MSFFDALTEPTVIICLSFSLLLFFFPNQGKRIGDWILVLLGNTSVNIKSRIIAKSWCYRRGVLKKIYNPHEMQWQIVRTYSLMILFAMCVIIYFLLIFVGPLKGIGQLPVVVQLFVTTPVLVCEVLWLTQRANTRYLIRMAGKRVVNSK